METWKAKFEVVTAKAALAEKEYQTEHSRDWATLTARTAGHKRELAEQLRKHGLDLDAALVAERQVTKAKLDGQATAFEEAKTHWKKLEEVAAAAREHERKQAEIVWKVPSLSLSLNSVYMWECVCVCVCA